MPQLINRLDALKGRRGRTGYHADGAGLYRQVGGGGARSCIYRFTLNQRTRDMGLCSATTFTLADARQEAMRQQRPGRLDSSRSRQCERPPSHITGNDHHDTTSESNRTFWIRW